MHSRCADARAARRRSRMRRRASASRRRRRTCFATVRRGAAHAVDLAHFNEVIGVDAAAGVVKAEGMITLRRPGRRDAGARRDAGGGAAVEVDHAGRRGRGRGHRVVVVPPRPRARTIVALDVLTGDGRIVTCTPDNEHRDLFRGFPEFVRHARLRARGHRPARRRSSRSSRWSTSATATPTRASPTSRGIAPTAGSIFSTAPCSRPTRSTSRSGALPTPPRTPATTRSSASITARSASAREDYLRTRDYLWRWDTDWFWCSKNVGAQHPLLRRLLGRKRLNSITYQRIMRWNSRCGRRAARWDRLRGVHTESVIQDVDIPLDRAAEFLAFLHADIGIRPIWICPIRAHAPRRNFPLYPLRPGTVFINFGFWDIVTSRDAASAGLSQPQGRAQGRRTRRPQIALLRLVLHRGRILVGVRPRAPMRR